MANLEPMPAVGPSGFIGGLPYFFNVFLSKLVRSVVISKFLGEIKVEQRKLDEILRDLGKQAKEIGLSHAPIDTEMGNLHALEEQRSGMEVGNAEISGQLQQAEATCEAATKDCEARIAAAQEQINTTQAALNQKNTELKTARGALAQQDKQLNGFSATLRSKTAAAAKSQDQAKQQALEQEAVDLSAKIAELEQQKATTGAEVAAVEGPVTELTATLVDNRTRLQEAQKELAAARQELAQTKQSLGAEERQKGQELQRLDRELAQKFLDIGRLLETNRAVNPAFEELYGRIDEAQTGIRTQEESITQLQADREAYDHKAFKNGMIIFLGLAGFVVLAMLTLIILFSFVFN
jgi:chromosome segregation ATPase